MSSQIRPRSWLSIAFFLSVLSGVPAAGQTPPPAPASTPGEVSVREETLTFQSRSNLVMVPVVVRGPDGATVKGLRQTDFQVLDNGKVQTITKFSEEHSGVSAGRTEATTSAPQAVTPAETPATQTPLATAAENFIAYLFDDVHAAGADLAHAAEAAQRQIETRQQATDRAAIYTTSGQVTEEFTDDRQRLIDALRRLRPRPLLRTESPECPEMNYYVADQVLNENNGIIRRALTFQAMRCWNGTDISEGQAMGIMEDAARRFLTAGEQEARVALTSLRTIVRRLTALPGRRVLVLTSPGVLITRKFYFDRADLIEQAVRARVVINTLDARGLYTDPVDQASRSGIATVKSSEFFEYVRTAESLRGEVLADLATGTGGTWVHNNNDFAGAFQRLAGTPETIYMLGFSPQNLRSDGKLHALKVTLKNSARLTVQARNGYYAPRSDANPEETAKREIEEAVFSRDEVVEIPVQYRTQYFKKDDVNARLSVISRIDARGIRTRKLEGGGESHLIVVTAVFDNNGNLVGAHKQTVDLRLRDETIANRLGSGLSLKSAFDVTSGAYAIRVVVRDSLGQMMSAINGTASIP